MAEVLVELKVEAATAADIVARRAASPQRRRYIDETMVTVSRLALAAPERVG